MERAFTKKGLATRQRIVEGAVELICARGVEKLSLDDVGAATSTSKSQLFHYFPDGRAELLLAVARFEAERVLADQQPYLDDLSSWAAWQSWRELVIEHYRRQGRCCPLSLLVEQLGRNTPEARAVVADLLNRWQAKVVAGVRATQERGDFVADVDPVEAAVALLAGIQGGAVALSATGRIDHLVAAIDLSLHRLRP